MTTTRRTLLAAVSLLLPGIARGQAAIPTDAYTPSDPARVGGSGRPQLVEFFHPL